MNQQLSLFKPEPKPPVAQPAITKTREGDKIISWRERKCGQVIYYTGKLTWGPFDQFGAAAQAIILTSSEPDAQDIGWHRYITFGDIIKEGGAE